MKKMLSLLVAAVFVASAVGVAFSAPSQKRTSSKAKAEKVEQTTFKPFAVYLENASKDNHYAPSGWMGDFGDLKLNQACTETPRSGNSCIKITYSAKMTQGAGWTGIFWQQPANNWGEKKGGYDLTGATKLTFWARGANGGEKIAEFKVGGITGEYPDSDSSSIGPIELTKEWQKYTIDLTGKDLSHIIGGFCFAASKDDNPNGFILYIDDVIFE
ncbi:MAG: hypothetical protein WCS83_02030 [Endomicrobiia bacterium]|nr:hypothetical protein [Endomicrobiaceae bacterium]MDD3922886.1 hypothetical protein [Endomicrobiaceae bacterium]